MAFDYRTVPLARPDGQMRIARLLPKIKDSMDVHLQLCAYDVDDCPPYVAISYTWGDILPEFPVTINDKSFMVRMNCWYALWQMHHHNVHTHFWIDSICINQRDVNEKNLQVARMGKFYSKAVLTASCLGPGSQLAVLAIHGACAADRTDALRKLHRKQYWSRMWIKQEIILSKDVRLFCGAEFFDWNIYGDAVASIGNMGQRERRQNQLTVEDQDDVIQTAQVALVEDRNLLHTSVTQDCDSAGPWAELWRLLEQYGDSDCQDPHDKIYALLSLLPDAGRAALDLPIDYECELGSFWLRSVDGCLKEWLATADSLHIAARTVPLYIWDTMKRMAHHWFHLKFDNPTICEFALEWSMQPTALSFGTVFSDGPQSAEHIPAATIFRRKLVSSEYNPWHLLSSEFDRQAWVSPQILVSQIDEWLEKLLPKGQAVVHGRYSSDRPSQAKGPFTMSSLPADALVKIVATELPFSDYRTAFLVPSIIQPGDELLGCKLIDHTRFEYSTPIVRPKHSTFSTKASGQNHLLVGWALRLQVDGTLRDDTALPKGRPDRNFGYSGVANGWPGLHVFNMHYKDLMLQSLLRQDALAYLTHPRTHRTHSSFFTESRLKEHDDD